jgi:hypothetical protein
MDVKLRIENPFVDRHGNNNNNNNKNSCIARYAHVVGLTALYSKTF